MAETDLLEKSDYATLYDRYLMNNGKKQLYGTQTKTGTKEGRNVYYLWPVADSENLDNLRLSAGLPPIASYMAAFQQMGMELIWDKSLTIKELKEQTATFIMD